MQPPRRRPSRPTPKAGSASAPFSAVRAKPYEASSPIPVPDPEDFAAWCENPTTRFVATAFVAAAEVQRRAWLRASWEAGEADPLKLAELRTRADAYLALTQTTLTQFCDFIVRIKDQA